MSIIDAHHHVWDLAVRDQDWITGPEMAPIRRSFAVDDLRPDAQAAGVTATVLVQSVTDSGALQPWASAIRDLAARPNTACKLSGLVTEAPPGARAADFTPFADVVFSAFGADRIMFGSDWPVCMLASDYQGVMELTRRLVSGLSAAEQAAVFTGTATRAYGLPASPAPLLS